MSTQPIFQLDEFEDMVGALSIENKTKTSNSITQGWRFGGSVAGNIEIPLSLSYYTILSPSRLRGRLRVRCIPLLVCGGLLGPFTVLGVSWCGHAYVRCCPVLPEPFRHKSHIQETRHFANFADTQWLAKVTCKSKEIIQPLTVVREQT